MGEINVIVQQEVGKITWNFEDIKNSLVEQLKIFKKTIYTDDTIKSAKEDIANLRKLAKDIEDRRKEVKAKCLEPYGNIEAQAKELVSLIDEPIRAINEQVNDYEVRRKQAVKKRIEEFWKEQAEILPEDIRTKAYKKIYDSKWENATCTMKAWKEGIQKGVQGINSDLQTIMDFHSEYEEEMLQEYYISLELRDSISKMNSLNAQRDRILELERRKKEEAERKAREEAEKKAEEEVKKQTESELKAEVVNPDIHSIKQPDIQEFIQEIKAPHDPVIEQEDNSITADIRIIGTAEQINKIKKFVIYTGAKYKEV